MWYRGERADERPSGRRDDGGKKGGKKGLMGKSDWCGGKDKESNGNKVKGKGLSETRCCHDCGEQRHFGVNCPSNWTKSIDEEDDQGLSWKSEFEGEKSEKLASLDAPDDETGE